MQTKMPLIYWLQFVNLPEYLGEREDFFWKILIEGVREFVIIFWGRGMNPRNPPFNIATVFHE